MTLVLESYYSGYSPLGVINLGHNYESYSQEYTKTWFYFVAHIFNHRCKCTSARVNPNIFCKTLYIYITLCTYKGDNLQFWQPNPCVNNYFIFFHSIYPLSIPTPPPIQLQLVQM